MIPNSLAALAGFLLLVAPGLLNDLLAARRRAGVPESTFRELSRTAFSSLVATVLAIPIVAFLAMQITGATWGNILSVVGQQNFPPEHRFALAVLFIATSFTACLLAGIWHLLKFRGNSSYVKPVSAWYQVFHEKIVEEEAVEKDSGPESGGIGIRRKKKKTQRALNPYVRIRLNNGYTYMGSLAGYNQQIDTTGRELILKQPLYVAPPGKSPSLIGPFTDEHG